MTEKVYIISGTNRQQAVSLQVSKVYQQEFEALGVDSEIIDLQQLPADYLFSGLYENAGKNELVNGFREKMKVGHKFVFVIAEYNGSFPGVLKAFIDGLEFPDSFMNKKCALVGLSAGIQGAVLAMSHFTDILNYCGAHVLAEKPKLASIGGHIQDGEITNERYMKHIKKQVKQLIEF
ncbi:MAG: NAD(P)H-dependent oxidoreductase [Cyclobacteriaceae bacterium]|nr:NAD(P)H-dependent oxidoreductase [Cyclobacteriaceae bacterium]